MICLRKRGGVVMSEDVHRRGKTIDEIKEGDSLTLGKHTLAFVEAPMVHWPEVIVT